MSTVDYVARHPERALSLYQQHVVKTADPTVVCPAPTAAVLLRFKLIDQDGYLTPRGESVARTLEND